MKLTERIYFALADGINLERLLRATGIDAATFQLKLDDNQFNDDERKAIKQELMEWEGGR